MKQSLVILIPVFNDWESTQQLIPMLDSALCHSQHDVEVLLVDDGSTICSPRNLLEQPLRYISRVQVLRLRRNLGHQRAITVGLCYIHDHYAVDAVLVMDCDGEDRPSDVAHLIEEFAAHQSRKAIFAGREKRSERITFRVFYQLYRTLHWLLTGRGVRVGNFSILPWSAVESLVVVSEMWSHYAAAVFKARIPHVILPTTRGHRLAGHSAMNFVSLITHGLAAISVYGESVGVRLLCATGFLILLSSIGVAITVLLRLCTTLAIPGWATTVTGVLGILLLQAVMMATLFVFVILTSRQGATFIPARDYQYFVATLDLISETHEPLYV